MEPQTGIAKQEDKTEISSREEHVRQVEDHSLPAQDVLTDQHTGSTPSEAPVLFVP
ncbi:MAG TPA: hypothetical protein VMJ64_05925 [Anaerolineales bacterium]|nr:hypothetical protein [Anaerolineales bacterium]